MPDPADQCPLTLAATATAATSLHWVCFRHPSRPYTGGQVVYRSDTFVVLVRGCYSDYGSCCYFVLLGHISSSKAGFVQCFERREQYTVGLCFFVATYKTFLGHFHLFCSHSALPTKMICRNLFIFVVLWSRSGVGIRKKS